MTTVLLAMASTAIVIPLILWLDGALNKNEDFNSVNQWNNFQKGMKK